MPFSARIGFFKPAAVTPPADFPDWPTIATESEMLTTLGTLASTGAPVGAQLSTGLSNNTAAVDCAHLPDGNVIFGSWNRNEFYLFEPSSNTTTTITKGDTGITGGMSLTPYNSNVYIGPRDSRTMYEFDYTSSTVTRKTNKFPTNIRCESAVTLKSNVIIFQPNGSNGTDHTYLEYDPSTDTLSSMGFELVADNSHGGGCLSLDGNVYYPPFASGNTHVVKYDATADSFSSFSVGADGWGSFVMGVSGALYGIPQDNNSVLVIEPANADNYYTMSTSLSGSDKFRGGALASDGNIYCSTYRSTSSWFGIDTINNTTFTASYVTTTGSRSIGTTFVGDGIDRIYTMPLVNGSDRIYTLDVSGNASVSGNLWLQPYLEN